MKKYTKEQKQNTLKKLARAYGKWNVPDRSDEDERSREKRSCDMYRSVFSVISKFGLRDEYNKALRKYDRYRK